MNLNEKARAAAIGAANEIAIDGAPVPEYVDAIISAYLSALVPADVSALVERLFEQSGAVEDAIARRHYLVDVARGLRSNALQAAALLSSQAARILELEAVLRTTRTLVSEAALTGFNCHEGKWAEQLYANQAAISKMVDPPRRSLLNRSHPHD